MSISLRLLCLFAFFVTGFEVKSEELTLQEVRTANFPNGSNSDRLFKTDEGIYIVLNVDDSEQGRSFRQIWRGNLDGTMFRSLIELPIDLSNPSGLGNIARKNFIQLGSRVVFTVDRELYALNLGNKQVQQLLQLPASPDMESGIRQLTKVGNAVFFVAGADSSPQLWKSSGTEESTVLVQNLPTGDEFFNGGPGNLFAYKNKLYFTHDDGVVGGEPWVSDGTPEGTKLFLDIDPDTVSCGQPCSSNVKNFSNLDGMLVFDTAAAFNAGRSEFWISDGTVENTQPFFSLDGAGGQVYLPFGSSLLVASGSDFNLNELWQVATTTEGSSRVIQLYPTNSVINQLFLEQAVLFNGKGYFGFVTPDASTFDNVSYDIWETDGTTSGTGIVVSRIKPSSASSISATGLLSFSGGVVFSEQTCRGGMMESICSNEVKLFDGSVVSSLISFSNNQNVFLSTESMLTTEDSLFLLVSINGALKLFSTATSPPIDISPIFQTLFDDD